MTADVYLEDTSGFAVKDGTDWEGGFGDTGFHARCLAFSISRSLIVGDVRRDSEVWSQSLIYHPDLADDCLVRMVS
jgi:hypothetical protein